MSADFVVCNADFDVVAVIELDDRSHDAAKRKRADATKDSAFRSAGIEVIRWHVRAMPDVATVRKAIGVA
jgi:very-short-patch-repair endonuclease